MITRRLPASFAAAGFTDPDTARRQGHRFRRLMIGVDGPWDSGKTEFGLSAPGPGIGIALDRNFDALYDNPNPPKTRRDDWAWKIVEVPKATQLNVTQNNNPYIEHWRSFYGTYLSALKLDECRSIILDGDTDSWELQRLAEFGRLSKVPSNLYDNVNAARRAMYARAFDSGKIIIATNRVRKEYETVHNPDGTVKLTNSGSEVREWTGNWERQGFGDQDYLWNIQLRMTNEDIEGGGRRYGCRIMKCKADPMVVGQELWGDDCNFPTLVQLVYPNVPLSEWGY